MASQVNRENLVYIAKLAEKAERYNEVVSTMKKVAKLDGDLTIEERNLFSSGYKNVTGAPRLSWRILSSIEQEEAAKGNELHVKLIREYMHLVESELTDTCNDVLFFIDEHLFPSASPGEPFIFYNKMKGDYYRYLAEFKTRDEKREVAELSLKAYEAALITAETDLTPSHPVRLGLALNFSVFYHDIMNSTERACQLAQQAFDGALSEIDTSSDTTYKDSTVIMQILNDNIIMWTADLLNEEDPSKKASTSKSSGIQD